MKQVTRFWVGKPKNWEVLFETDNFIPNLCKKTPVYYIDRYYFVRLIELKVTQDGYLVQDIYLKAINHDNS